METFYLETFNTYKTITAVWKNKYPFLDYSPPLARVLAVQDKICKRAHNDMMHISAPTFVQAAFGRFQKGVC